jgi:hypothetical protein
VLEKAEDGPQEVGRWRMARMGQRPSPTLAAAGI